MFIVGLPGAELTAIEAGLLSECRFGGIILFAHNLHEPEQIYALCRALWDQRSGELAPFVAIDQEGGRVHHTRTTLERDWPAAETVEGRSRRRSRIRILARDTGISAASQALASTSSAIRPFCSLHQLFADYSRSSDNGVCDAARLAGRYVAIATAIATSPTTEP